MDFAIERYNNRQYTTPETILIGPNIAGGVQGGVESVSVNDGEKNFPDSDGNVNITIAAGNLAEKLNTNITVGGISSGTTFEAGSSIEDILKSLLVKEIAPTATMSLDPAAGIYQITDTGQTLVFARVSVLKNSADRITKVMFQDGVESREMIQVGDVYTLAVNRKYKVDSTFTAVISYLKSNKESATMNITSGYKFINPIITFKTTNPKLLTNLVLNLNNLDSTFVPDLVSIGTSGYKYPANIEAGYVGVGFPNEKVIRSITDNNGFEYINAFTKTTIKVKDKAGNTIKYNFYMSPKATLTGSFAYTFK